MSTNVLYIPPAELFMSFMTDYTTFYGIPEGERLALQKKVQGALLFHKNRKQIGGVCSPIAHLEERWYNSLIKNTPDYEVYAHADYIVEAYLCWAVYSRKYLRILNANTYLDPTLFKNVTIVDAVTTNVRIILDVGNGLGYSTAALASLFPYSTVFGTNVRDSVQYKFCEYISNKYRFSMVSSFEGMQDIDLIFASEYFEHFESPIEHLEMMLDETSPKYLVIANSFNTRAAGHFPVYNVYGRNILAKDLSRIFSNTLFKRGYLRVPIKIFNNRPMIYMHNTHKLEIGGHRLKIF